MTVVNESRGSSRYSYADRLATKFSHGNVPGWTGSRGDFCGKEDTPGSGRGGEAGIAPGRRRRRIVPRAIVTEAARAGSYMARPIPDGREIRAERSPLCIPPTIAVVTGEVAKVAINQHRSR